MKKEENSAFEPGAKEVKMGQCSGDGDWSCYVLGPCSHKACKVGELLPSKGAGVDWSAVIPPCPANPVLSRPEVSKISV